jgi:hypothetical protein
MGETEKAKQFEKQITQVLTTPETAAIKRFNLYYDL